MWNSEAAKFVIQKATLRENHYGLWIPKMMLMKPSHLSWRGGGFNLRSWIMTQLAHLLSLKTHSKSSPLKNGRLAKKRYEIPSFWDTKAASFQGFSLSVRFTETKKYRCITKKETSRFQMVQVIRFHLCKTLEMVMWLLFNKPWRSSLVGCIVRIRILWFVIRNKNIHG